MSRRERAVLTARAVWWSIFVASLVGAVVSAFFSWWLIFACLLVAFCCWTVALLVRLLMGGDQ